MGTAFSMSFFYSWHKTHSRAYEKTRMNTSPLLGHQHTAYDLALLFRVGVPGNKASVSDDGWNDQRKTKDQLGAKDMMMVVDMQGSE